MVRKTEADIEVTMIEEIEIEEIEEDTETETLIVGMEVIDPRVASIVGKKDILLRIALNVKFKLLSTTTKRLQSGQKRPRRL